MLFTSYAFLGFLLVLFVLYYMLPQKAQWPLLLIASYVFYWCASPQYLLYILVTTATVYVAALQIQANATRQKAYLKTHKEELSREEKQQYKAAQKPKRLRWLVVCLLINLGILAVVKYTNFMIANLNGIFHALGQGEPLSFWNLSLPMGISFYTFQAVGYLVDVYRGTVSAQTNPFRFALFLSFFPQLVQGPISRYGDLSQTLYEPHPFRTHVVASGLQRMLWGYFKKLVIADRLLPAVTTLVGNSSTYTGAYAFVGMIFYTINLYADFTGGIDITIGIAETMGITVQENFHRPYFSKSLKEYWRRWHISMASWFRDYVFYPVSISAPMQRLTKVCRQRFGNQVGRRIPVYLSTFLVWLATGVWHGASWNFIVWGLSNFAVLMISEELEPLYGRFHRRFHVDGTLWYKVFQVARTFLLIAALNLFDCYTSIGETVQAFLSMFTARNWHILWDGSLLQLGLTMADYGVLAAATLLVFGVSLAQRSGSVREKLHTCPYPVRFVTWYGLFLVVLLLGAYGIGYDASQFIYNQF